MAETETEFRSNIRSRSARPCAIEGCDKPSNQGGGRYCAMHYSRLRRNGNPHIRSKRVYLTHQPCMVEECERNVAGRGLCGAHWQQWKRHGRTWVEPQRVFWNKQDVERLESILDRAPDGLGHALPGELVHAAIVMERTVMVVHSKLRDLRKARRRAQTRFNRG